MVESSWDCPELVESLIRLFISFCHYREATFKALLHYVLFHSGF